MSVVSLTGQDTIIIDEHQFFDLADGDAVTITYPNNIAGVKTGKYGNALYASNESGKLCEIIMRLVMGSSDDKLLQSRLKEQERDFSAFTLMQGSFVKRTGDGQGNITRNEYILRGGVFLKRVETKTNAEGDTEQSVSVYTMHFRDGDKALT